MGRMHEEDAWGGADLCAGDDIEGGIDRLGRRKRQLAHGERMPIENAAAVEHDLSRAGIAKGVSGLQVAGAVERRMHDIYARSSKDLSLFEWVQMPRGSTDAQNTASVRKSKARSQSCGRSSVSKVSQNGMTTEL